MKWHYQAIAHNISVVDLNVLALLISAHDHRMTDISALESSAFKRPWLALNEWISGPRAFNSPLGAWRLRSKSWCRPSRKFLSTPKFFASQTLTELCLSRQKYNYPRFTPLNLSLWCLPKKQKVYEPRSQPTLFYEEKVRESLVSKWACNHISFAQLLTLPRNCGRFQDGGNFEYFRQVNIFVHLTDLLYSLHDTRIDWLFYCNGYVFLVRWHLYRGAIAHAV